MSEQKNPSPTAIGSKTKKILSILGSLFVLYIGFSAYKLSMMIPNALWRTESLLRLLSDDTDRKMSMVAGQELVRRGSKVVPQILQVLNHNKTSQAAGAMALGQIGDRQALEPLSALLESEDETVRYHAAYALATMKDERGVNYLKAALANADGGMKFQLESDLKRLGVSGQ